MLPDSSFQKDRAKKNPYMFADTGINLFLKKLVQDGAQKKTCE